MLGDVTGVAFECVNGSLVIQESSGCPSWSVAVAGRLRNASACISFASALCLSEEQTSHSWAGLQALRNYFGAAESTRF